MAPEQGIFGNGVGVGNGVYDGTKIMGRMAKELALGIRCFSHVHLNSTVQDSVVQSSAVQYTTCRA